jgi:hypothetical protein
MMASGIGHVRPLQHTYLFIVPNLSCNRVGYISKLVGVPNTIVDLDISTWKSPMLIPTETCVGIAFVTATNNSGASHNQLECAGKCGGKRFAHLASTKTKLPLYVNASKSLCMAAKMSC